MGGAVDVLLLTQGVERGVFLGRPVRTERFCNVLFRLQSGHILVDKPFDQVSLAAELRLLSERVQDPVSSCFRKLGPCPFWFRFP